jgi:hypothetical protein
MEHGAKEEDEKVGIPEVRRKREDRFARMREDGRKEDKEDQDTGGQMSEVRGRMDGLVPLALWMIGIDDKEGMTGLRPLEGEPSAGGGLRLEAEKLKAQRRQARN